MLDVWIREESAEIEINYFFNDWSTNFSWIESIFIIYTKNVKFIFFSTPVLLVRTNKQTKFFTSKTPLKNFQFPHQSAYSPEKFRFYPRLFLYHKRVEHANSTRSVEKKKEQRIPEKSDQSQNRRTQTRTHTHTQRTRKQREQRAVPFLFN